MGPVHRGDVKSLKATLAAARTIDDLLVVRGQAEAVRYAMQVRGDSLEAMNDAAEIKLRAERKLGTLLAETVRPAQRRSRRTAPGLRPPRRMMAVSVWGPPITCGSGRGSIQSTSSFPSPRALARRNRGLPIVHARLSTRTPPRSRRRASRSGGGSAASCVVVWVFVVIAGPAL
jgi:hypothetical protein